MKVSSAVSISVSVAIASLAVVANAVKSSGQDDQEVSKREYGAVTGGLVQYWKAIQAETKGAIVPDKKRRDGTYLDVLTIVGGKLTSYIHTNNGSVHAYGARDIKIRLLKSSKFNKFETIDDSGKVQMRGRYLVEGNALKICMIHDPESEKDTHTDVFPTMRGDEFVTVKGDGNYIWSFRAATDNDIKDFFKHITK